MGFVFFYLICMKKIYIFLFFIFKKCYNYDGDIMKRLVIILLFINIFLLTGCTKDEYFVCEINLDNEIQEYHLDATYKVYYKKSFVTKIEKEEIYISSNKDTLNYFNEYKNLEYLNLNNLYGGVIHTVNLKQDKVSVNAIIDMSLTNIKQMVKDKYIDNNYVTSNKLTTGGIKNIYKEKGAICDI